MTTTRSLPQGRLVSLDVFRGLIMFLLIAEGCNVYHSLTEWISPGTLGASIITQFHHHPWNGLRFWDLIQPFFMFIVGVAMWFSIRKRTQAGDSWNTNFRHIGKRCLILLAFGVTLHISYADRLVWELWNVLSQLSVTIMIAFLIMRLPIRTQLIISFGLILLTEILYRYANIPGYDQAFVKDQNFGSFMDMVLMGKINNGGGWVTINCIPTAAHTIWGVIAGDWISRNISAKEKIKPLIIWGLAGLIIGYGLDWSGITPIIKRICTSSFVIVSGGWCLLVLAAMYWIIDVKKINKGYFPLLTIGMNSIFMYVFMETVGKEWFKEFIGIFTGDTLSAMNANEHFIEVITAFVTLILVTLLSIWLYRKRLFFKI